MRRHHRGDGVVDLAEEVLYWGAKSIDGDRLPGTSFTAAERALHTWGQPKEEFWPYKQDRDETADDYEPPPSALAPQDCFLAPMRPLPVSLRPLRRALVERQLVVLGIPLWDGFFQPKGAILDVPPNKDLLPAFHAVAAVGYDDPLQAFRIRNSWGPGWGENGYAWLPYEFHEQVLEAWVVAP